MVVQRDELNRSAQAPSSSSSEEPAERLRHRVGLQGDAKIDV